MLNKIINKKNNKNKNKQTKTRARKPIPRRLPNNRTKRANVIRGKKVAAASAANFSKRFNIMRQNGNSVRVSGRDLIYAIPDTLTAPVQSTNVIAVIPANPAYWTGTRIAALAAGYQNYRPLLFKITYVPMCAVTQQGNVIAGTIWDDGFDNDNIQQSLRTSNGGFITQCYVPHTTTIRPKTNLQFNLYRMGGDFNNQANPFIFIAIAVGCKNASNERIVPGYFYVTWSFELKNPVGSNTQYYNSGLTTYEELDDMYHLNNTLINIQTDTEIPFGAYIDIEELEDAYQPSYNETPITIESNTPVWLFSSVTKASNSTKTVTKNQIYYSGLTTGNIDITTNSNKGWIINDEDNSRYIIYIPTIPSSEPLYRYTNSEVAFLITNTNQIFGTLNSTQNLTFTAIRGSSTSTTTLSTNIFYADKSQFTIELGNRKEIKATKKIYTKKVIKLEENKEEDNEEEQLIK